MATYINNGTGNWSTAASWYTCDSTAENDSEAANTALTTSYVTSSTFTPGAITIDGIAVKIASRAASPSGTMTVALDQGGSDVANTVITINVSDLDVGIGGWQLFKFGSNVALAGATAYSVKAKTSSSSQVNLYSSATTNWSRELRTTTSPGAAPAAGDKIIICGELTGAGTGNDRTVTLDNDQSGVSIGNTSFPQSIHVSKRGTLTFANNSKSKWKGVFGVYGGGTLNCGTNGSSITAELLMDVATNVDTGLVFNGSTVNIYGNSKSVVNTLMTADKAAAATVITLASTSGWAGSDVLAFASTTRTAGDCESKTISTVDSSTQVTLTAGLTNAHSGTSPTQAEVINLTRSVKIHGTSTSLQGYVLVNATAVVNIQYAEFYWLGSSTASKRGIDVQTTTGTCIFKYCSIHDHVVANSHGFNVSGGSGQTAPTFIFSNNVGYNVNLSFFQIAATSGAWVADSNIGMLTGNVTYSLADVGGTFTNNTAVGGTTGISANEAGSFVAFSGNTTHSNSGAGLNITGVRSCALNTLTAWRNGSNGCGISALTTPMWDITADGWVLFGNLTNNIVLGTLFNSLFTNLVSSGDTTFSTTSGVTISNLNSIGNVYFENCTFGVVSGIKTAHTQDINSNGSNSSSFAIFLRNCLLASSTEVASWAASTINAYSFITSIKHDQTTGNHKFWLRYGIGTTDTTIYNTASPSLRLTPNTAGSKMESALPTTVGTYKVHVDNGVAPTVTVKVRKSRSTDSSGANYNGSQQRLLIRKNVALGVNSDTVLATATWSDANLLTLNPEAFGAWTITDGTVTADNTMAPDGTLTADKLTEDTANSTHRVANTGLTTAATTTFSIYAKAGTRTKIELVETQGGKTRGFDLSNGTSFTVTGQTDAAAYGITADTNGFYRCYIQVPTGSGFQVQVRMVSGTADFYNGDGSSYVYLWGAMLNSGTTPGTYIPASTNTWEQLSATAAAPTDDGVMEFIVDCDGTAGWVNVDDWSHTPMKDGRGGKYYLEGLPFLAGGGSGVSRGRIVLA